MAKRDRRGDTQVSQNSFRTAAQEMLDGDFWSNEFRSVTRDYFAPVTAAAHAVAKTFSSRNSGQRRDKKRA